MYSYRHECHASEDHIDAHEEPERPGSRARKSGKDDAGDDTTGSSMASVATIVAMPRR
jgi:hypothetical protein